MDINLKKEFYVDGTLAFEMHVKGNLAHRTDGPAKTHFSKTGKLEWEDWLIDGNLHRLDGPARINYKTTGHKRERWFIIIKR